MNNRVPKYPRIIQLPKVHDQRGNLTFVENTGSIPFRIQRTFWIYDVPGGEERSGHAKKSLEEFIIALTGSFEVMVDDGMNKITYTLNRSYYGLYVPSLHWRELINFSTNAIALFIVSRSFEKEDYIYHYEDFMRYRNGKQ